MLFYKRLYQVKPVLSGHLKRFKTDYRLMKVKSIAECILQYFRPSLSCYLSVRSLFCLFLSGHLRQVLLEIQGYEKNISSAVWPVKLNDYIYPTANTNVPSNSALSFSLGRESNSLTHIYRTGCGTHELSMIWASTRENLTSGLCAQKRRRPACASAQSDQRFYYSLIAKYHI